MKSIRTTQPKLEESTINSTARILWEAFERIPGAKSIDRQFCEELSCFLNLTYSTRNRAYHDIRHTHEVALGTSPLATIAALFHDVVYIQVDRARLPELRLLFSAFDPGDNLQLIIPSASVLATDTWMEALVTLFGYSPGQTLQPFTGINEFLSAWIAICKLRRHLGAWELLHILAGIEATIPFRSDPNDPDSNSKTLYYNLERASRCFHFRPTEEQLCSAVLDATFITNNDVKSFSSPDPASFLYSSWALLFESNPSLQTKHYRVSQYREALKKMEGFFSSLDPNVIYRSFKNFPDLKEMTKLQKAARRNLNIGSEYIRIKLVDTCIVEALGLLTGGDAPLEMFIGSRPNRREVKCVNIECFLNRNIPKIKQPKDSQILDLLSVGIAFRSKFDLKTSPLAQYLFERMTTGEITVAFSSSQKFMKRELQPYEFLMTLRPELVYSVANAISKIAWTREKQLSLIAEQFKLRKLAA